MAAQVLSFFQRSPRYAPAPADWSQQELAEFYRVESALIRAGIRVGTDRGMSDENEPWFVFYRSDDGEVVLHFARIDGEYLIAGPAYEEIARGFDFSTLVRNMVARHPLIRRSDNNSNLSIHPAALLVAVVGTAFFKTGEARAAETGAHTAHSRPVLLSSSSNAGLTNGVAPMNMSQPTYDSVQIPANQAVLILAAALLASDYGVDTTSLDPGVRTAISAAAASLDFGSTSVPTSPSGGLTLPSGAHAALPEPTPAQAMSTVLSLVAVLSTLPHSADAPSTSDFMLSGRDAARHDLTSTTLPAPTDAPNWAIDVHLGLDAGGLPSVEAIQLVRGLVGEVNAQKISVIEVAKLPDVLADLISKGDHFNVGSPAPPPFETPPATVGSPPTGGDGPATPPPTDTIPTPPPIDTVTTPPIESPTAPAYASPDLVKQFIDYFIAHTGGVEIMVKGSQIVMFDERVLHDPGTIGYLESMTFNFADGGSISLVGEHSSFLHTGILV